MRSVTETSATHTTHTALVDVSSSAAVEFGPTTTGSGDIPALCFS